jgi:hypothetical protein
VEGVKFCTIRKPGALLSLPNGGRHEDAIRTNVFRDYMIKHVDRWFNWAQNNKLDVEQMEDIIFVSGCTLVTSWAAAAFMYDANETTIRLASRTGDGPGCSAMFDWSHIRGRVIYHDSNTPSRSEASPFPRLRLVGRH